MKVTPPAAAAIDLGITETTPTIGIKDYSRRVTDDFGVTTVVQRGFSRTMSVRFKVPHGEADRISRTCAALRATAAQWTADDRFSWLDIQGFYKDFQVDFKTKTLSFCSLTVEGLTEPDADPDPGGDPAPQGASSLVLLQPVEITPAKLVASNVLETDYPTWAAGTAYATGARVIKLATHRIYESVVDGNIGNDPAAASGLWLDIGPTNRWAMFDQALGTITSAAGSIAVTIAAGAVDSLALLDVVGATARVQTTGYDRIVPVGEGALTFLDLPGVAANVTVTITGPGTVSVGTLLVGTLARLGVTGEDASTGINDYSRKETDDFGEVTIVERSWAKRMSATALVRTDAIDAVANRIAAVRAVPSLWIAADGTDSLTVYGFFKDFSIEVGEAVSTLSLSIEGLSEAAPLSMGLPAPNWTDIVDNDPVDHPKPEDGATVGAPAGTDVAGRPATLVLEQVDETVQGVADLVEIYGDTASAAASAATASAAAANAQAARDDAQDAFDAADAARIAAEAAQNTAAASAIDSDAAREAAEAAQTASETARNQAQTAATNADGSATAAAGSASTASTKATDASNSASAAAASATTATTKAGEAAGSASAASTSATSAGTSATNAGNSATAASNAKVAAESARDAAAGSATAAAGSASTASTKATEAGTSASAAAGSATTATTKAGEASTSAGQAATSATNAAGSASTASTQATNAANSATAAGGSATAAAGSASTASTKATEAGNSATSASGSANTATTKAGEAAGSASAAAGSASAASTSATNSANSASAALSSSVSANLSAAMMLPDRYDGSAGQYFTAGLTGAPAAVTDLPSNATASGYGPVRSITQTGTASSDFGTRGVVPAVAGRIYEIEVEFQRTAQTGSGSPVPGVAISIRNLDGTYGDLGGIASTTVALTGSVQTVSAKFSSSASSGVIAWNAGAVWLRPYLRAVNRDGYTTTIEARRITIRNVTERDAAAGSASAAATSASTAATKATEAGTSASAAAGSATTASTAAGTATTKASEASTSATNAAGSASTASTQATNAANSATAAGGSATAAAGSASTASTQATNANNSATAANTAKVAAESARDNASSSASAASGSAATASSQASVATTQAGLAANYSAASKDAMAAGYPRAVMLDALTVDYNNFGAAPLTSAYSVSPGVVQSSNAMSYGFGMWAIKPMPMTAGLKVRVTASLSHEAGASTAYTVGYVSYFDAAGAVISNSTVGSYTSYSYGAGVRRTVTFDWDSASAPVDTASVRFGILTNRTNAGSINSGTVRTYIYSLYLEDVTSEMAATAQAGIAASQAATASAQASTATTQAGLSATYRDQSQGYRNEAEGFKNTASTQAGVSTSQAAIATAAASAAQQSAILSASVGQGALNLNTGFDDYPSATVGQLPTGWVAAAGSAHYRVADPFGGYSIRVPGVAGSNAQIAQTSQQTTPVLTPNGWYVLEVDAVLNSGTWTGAGMQFRSFNAAGTQLTTYTFPLSSTPTINGSNPANTTGALCQWRKLVQVTDATAKGTRVDFGSHLSGGGSNAAANDITFQKVVLRAATSTEIRDQTVLAPMEATVSTTSAALATLNGAAATWETIVAAGGGSPAIARLKAGLGGSAIDLGATRLSVYNPDDEGELYEVARFEGGKAQLNDALIRNLQVAPNDTSEVFFPVQLKPRIYLGKHNDVIQYDGGKTLGATPERITADIQGIAVGAGEALEIRAINISATQFKVRAVKITPTAPANQSTGAGSNVGGTPAWQVHKPTTADAYNGYYQYSFTVTLALTSSVYNEFKDKYRNWYGGTVGIYVNAGSGWVLVETASITTSTLTTTQPASGSTLSYAATWSTQYNDAIGQHGGTEFGIHSGPGATVTAFAGVSYTTQTPGTETALTQMIPFYVYPPVT